MCQAANELFRKCVCMVIDDAGTTCQYIAVADVTLQSFTMGSFVSAVCMRSCQRNGMHGGYVFVKN